MKKIVANILVLMLFVCLISNQNVFAAGNGDGYTPYNLVWDKNGSITFEKQRLGELYRLNLYKSNGEWVGVENAFPDKAESLKTTISFVNDITESGDYYVTINVGDWSGGMINEVKEGAGEFAKSPIFRYKKPSKTLSNPTNLRWEVKDGTAYAKWDSGANMAEGDFYEVHIDLQSTSGSGIWSILVPAVKETSYMLDCANIGGGGLPGEPGNGNGIYTFEVRSISSDINRASTNPATVKCMITYEYPSGKISAKKITDLSDMSVSEMKNKSYTGKSITQKVVVKNGNIALKNGTDYKVTYERNKAIGVATVKISGTGEYTGTVVKTFEILPPKTSFTSVKAGKGGIVELSWKMGSGVSGYEIYYSTKKNGTYKMLVSINKNTTTSYVTKKLDKKYYFKIRTYTVTEQKTCYSLFSVIK